MNPTVSVIVPVYNASATLDSVVEALLSQSYPAGFTELIIIDNCSTDGTKTILKKYPVTLLSECTLKSPYAARNFGIRHASGEIIAFTDANKIPDVSWIEQGVAVLQKSGADLAGGDIQFDIGSEPETAKVYDSITFNDNRNLVENENGAACGNLFVRRKVFRTNGLFPSKVRSGMDIWWTQKAVRNGCKLVFAEKAVVRCVPRTLSEVIKKSYRVGVSHPINMKSSGMNGAAVFWTAIKTLSPPRVSDLKKKLSKSVKSVSLLKLWTVAWVSKTAMAVGRLYGLFFMNSKPETKPFRPLASDKEADA